MRMDGPADVVLVVADLGSGGAQKVLVTLANAWAQSGRSVSVVTVAGAQEDFFVLKPEVNRLRINGKKCRHAFPVNILANVRRVFRLRRALRHLGAPVAVSFILPTNIMAILAGVGLRVRIVVSERNDPARQFLGWHWTILRWLLYRYADLVTANTHGALLEMKRYVPHRKLAYLPNPLTEYQEASPARVDETIAPMLLTVGRLHAQKGHDLLVEAFARVSAQAPNWRLGIVGAGPLLKTLMSQAKRSGIAERIDWHGQLSDPSVMYRRADIFVLASRFEGTPNALLEAMSFGLPVIVTDASPGLLELVENDVTGLVVPAGDVAALASALLRLIDSRQLCRRLGESARSYVSRFQAERVLPVWEDILGLPRVKTARTHNACGLLDIMNEHL